MIDPERHTLVDGGMVLLRGVDDDDFCCAPITQLQSVRASMLLKLGQGQRCAIDSNLEARVMNEPCGQHRDDFIHIRHLAGNRHGQPCARTLSLTKLLGAHHKRTGPGFGTHDEGAELAIAPGFYLVLVAEAK
ncbi:hypothetical protein D3C81_1897310 [compost metagenome]